MLQTVTYGCDSLRTLDLEVRATTTGDTVANHCDQFTWYGTTYTASTETPTHLSTNAANCDSTTTLHLTIRYSSTGTEVDTIVQNSLPFSYHDSIFTDSISHATVIFPNSVQCDSIVDYTLFVYWNVDTTLYDTVCNDALPLAWNNVTFDTANAVSHTSILVRDTIFTAHTGADSLITMRLTVHPLYDHHTHTEICDNQQYLFGDSIFLGSDGTTEHLDSLLSIHGCDSLSTLHLTVHPTFDHHHYDTVCTQQLYTWGTPQRGIFVPGSVTASLHGRDTAAQFSILNSAFPSDTSVTDTLTSIHSCDSLSSLHLHLLPSYDLHFSDTICASEWTDSNGLWTGNFYPFEDTMYNLTGSYSHLFPTQSSGCDSIRTIHLKVYPTYDIQLFDTIYDGDHYTFEGTVYDTTGIYPHLLPAVFGCDSLRTLNLQRNRRTYNDSTLCQNSLPLIWNGITFADKPHSGGILIMSDSVHLSGLDGIDSLVVMTVYARDTSTTTVHLHACDSLTWQDNRTYFTTTMAPYVTLTNGADCDSVVHLDLTVDYTHFAIDQQEACDSMQWIDNRWYSRDIFGPIDTIRTVADCDSIVTLDLVVHYSTYEETLDTFCYANTYTWRRFTIGEENPQSTTDYYLTDTLRTQHNCDSVLAIWLTQMARPMTKIESEVDCQMMQYHIYLTTDMPYWRWWAEPADPAIDGIENSSEILVAPEATTNYNVTVDYHKEPLCPLTDHITLRHIEIPEAEMKVNPEALTLSNMELNAYDISHEYESRDWYINWQHQSEESRQLTYTAETSLDSVIVALRVYNGICYDTISKVVPILKASIYAPNVFTPLQETNNRFVIVGQGILEADLYVYNREGLLMYHTTDIEQGWDGRDSNGTLCPQGSYVWRLIYKAIDRPTAERTEIGTILLLK